MQVYSFLLANAAWWQVDGLVDLLGGTSASPPTLQSTIAEPTEMASSGA